MVWWIPGSLEFYTDPGGFLSHRVSTPEFKDDVRAEELLEENAQILRSGRSYGALRISSKVGVQSCCRFAAHAPPSGLSPPPRHFRG
jgi:hypothetical protein